MEWSLRERSLVQCPFAFLDSGNSYPLHHERAEPLCRLLRKLNASLILMMRPRVACPCSSCLPSVVDMGTCPEAPRLSARNADRQLCAFISYGSTSQRRAAQCYTNILDICSVCASPRRSYTREGFGEAGPGDGRSWKVLGSWRIIGRSGMLFTAGHAALRPSRLSAKGLGVETAERSAASLVLKFEPGSKTCQHIPKPAAVKA